MAATYAPRALLDLRAYLKIHTGITDNRALGIVSDDNDQSYHHGLVDRQTRDYSFDESPRDWSHTTDAASAIDIGNFARLRELSIWLAQRCEANRRDPKVNKDCADVREIIYSPDGRTVVRWDRLRIRSSGDSSHLTHTHVSWHRDAETRDKTAPFRVFFEGGGMTQPLGELYRNSRWGDYPDGKDRAPDQHIIDTALAVLFGETVLPFVKPDGTLVRERAWIVDILEDILEATRNVGVPDHETLVVALREALRDPEVAATIAQAVNDDAAQRMMSR